MSRVKRKQKAFLNAVISGRKILSEYFIESRCAFCRESKINSFVLAIFDKVENLIQRVLRILSTL